MKKKELILQIANQMKTDPHTAQIWVDTILENIYESLENRQTVTLENFGAFYIDKRQSGIVFKFNPSQKMRKMLGWSSKYK